MKFTTKVFQLRPYTWFGSAPGVEVEVTQISSKYVLRLRVKRGNDSISVITEHNNRIYAFESLQDWIFFMESKNEIPH